MSCPSALDLLRYATGEPDAVDATIASHVPTCAECMREVAALRGAAAVFRGTDDPSAPRTPACPTDDHIAALVEGTLDAEKREGLLPHVGTCSRCRALLASLSRARARVEASGGAVGRRFQWRGWIVSAAAAAVLLLVIWSRSDWSPTREPPGSVQTPGPITPKGQVDGPVSMIWSRLAHADKYRVTIFDREGAVVWETQTTDTTVALPPIVHLQSGVHYFWRVAARTGWEQWVESPLTEFAAARSHE